MGYRSSRLIPVKSDKHEITWSNLSQNASTQQSVRIIDGVQPSAKNLATECGIGSRVNGVYFEFHFSAESTTTAKVIHWDIDIVPAGTASFPNANTYYQTQRAEIIKRGMEMLPRDQGTVFKRIFVVGIPKKYRRVTDSVQMNLRYICSSSETINACGIAIYKEFS